MNNRTDAIIPIEDDHNYFDRFPEELVAYVFSFLDAQSISEISQTCRRFFLTIQNNSSLILYERFSKDALSLSLSNKQLLMLLLQSQEFNELRKSIQNISNILNDKNTVHQLSPFKLNGFFVHQNKLIQQGGEIEKQEDSLQASSSKRARNVLLSTAIPIVIGYLSGSNTLLLIGCALGMTIFGYGVHKGIGEEAQLINESVANTSLLHRLFTLARNHTAFSYDEKTIEFLKKYP